MKTTTQFKEFCNDMQVSESKMVQLIDNEATQATNFQSEYDANEETYFISYNLNGNTIEKSFTFSQLTE